MHRTDPRSAAIRSYSGVARATISKILDDPNMQTLDAGFLKDEARKGIERFQNYGFSSVPMGPDKDGKEGPEAIVTFQGGNRSNPIITGVDDRRHRPRGLKEGENAQYDHQGQMTYLAKDGTYIIGTQKEVSLRHAKKEKQERAKSNQKDNDGGTSKPAEKEKEYDHKGEVNTEVKATEKTIEAYIKDKMYMKIVDGKVYLGGDPDKGDKFGKVGTDAGISVNVYAKIG